MFLRKIAAPSSGSYSVSKSLRFRSSASAYLQRTFGTPTSATTWTISFWAKLGSILSSTAPFIGVYNASSNNFQIRYSSGNIEIYAPSTGTTLDLLLTQVFRDPSAWYHFVLTFDTTQTTASNRMKFYVNGSQVTAFTTATYPSLNATVPWNTNGTVCLIGAQNNPINGYFDGYMAEVNFIDGQALTPSSFGTYDTNGVWQPINYSGTYGTNGFHLTFGNTTSTTTLGYDTSGNSNNWTTNNISLTAGSTYDSMNDSPTVTSATVANYCVLNAALFSSVTLSNANLNYSIPVGTVYAVGTIASTSGKWYWETVPTSGNQLTAIGVASVDAVRNNKNYGSSTSANPIMAYEPISGSVYVNGSIVTTTTTSAANDTVAIAYDAGANTAAIYKNNTLLYTATLTGTSSGAMPFVSNPSGAQAAVGYINFGQRAFTYTPPTGFNALNTYNLPTPTIANGAQYMAATTYTGTGATQTISDGGNNTIGTTFQPDLVWIKSRSAATNNNLFDVLRGTTAYLISNSTATEATNANTLTAFGSTGFTVGSDASAIGVNVNAATYVGWQWKANGAGVSNTNGSITSTVSANTTAGFSIVSYTGNTTSGATVGHGLGVAPSMIIVKSRTNGTDGWVIYHVSVGNTKAVFFDTSTGTTQVAYWNNTSPSSTVFTLGSGTGANNTTANIAYCWAAVPGYSAFGSYTGNGSSDGPFVYANMRPRYVLIKRTDSTGDWYIWDTSRNTYNVVGEELLANTGGAGNTATDLDILSNGFKIRTTTAAINASGGTFVYAAFAENPFQNSRAR